MLASALKAVGSDDKAKLLLFHRALVKWSKQSVGLRWIGGAFLLVFIGFGYKMHYALLWFLAFFALGTVVALRQRLMCERQGNKHACPSFGEVIRTSVFSFDLLLPVIELDKRHYDESFRNLTVGALYYFYFHHFMGYVLAILLAAGVGGLVK